MCLRLIFNDLLFLMSHLYFYFNRKKSFMFYDMFYDMLTTCISNKKFKKLNATFKLMGFFIGGVS